MSTLESSLTTFSGFTQETALLEERTFTPMTYWDADFAVALTLEARGALENRTRECTPLLVKHVCDLGSVRITTDHFPSSPALQALIRAEPNP